MNFNKKFRYNRKTVHNRKVGQSPLLGRCKMSMKEKDNWTRTSKRWDLSTGSLPSEMPGKERLEKNRHTASLYTSSERHKKGSPKRMKMEKNLRTSWVYCTMHLMNHLEFVADIILELLGPGAMNLSLMVWVLGMALGSFSFHFY